MIKFNFINTRKIYYGCIFKIYDIEGIEEVGSSNILIGRLPNYSFTFKYRVLKWDLLRKINEHEYVSMTTNDKYMLEEYNLDNKPFILKTEKQDDVLIPFNYIEQYYNKWMNKDKLLKLGMKSIKVFNEHSAKEN